jgi:hypothetical protein
MEFRSFARSRTGAVVAGTTVLVALGGVGAAVAGSTIGSADSRGGATQALSGMGRFHHHHLEADGPYPGLTQLQQGANSTAMWLGDSGATLQQSWVMCARGKSAVGGGFGQTDGSVEAIKGLQFVTSRPATIKHGAIVDTAIPGDPDGSIRPNGWVVEGFNNGTTDLSVRPWVVCAVMR